MIKRSNLLFDVFILCIIMYQTLNTSTISIPGQQVLLFLGLALGMVKILTSFKINLWSALVMVVILGVVFYHFWVNGDNRLIVIMLAMLAAIDVEPTHIISVLFYSKLVSFLGAFALGAFQGQKNTIALHVGMLILMYICKQQQDLVKKNYLIVGLVYCLAIIYTGSGMAVLGGTLTILLIIIERFKWGKKFLTSKIVLFIYPICLFLNYSLAIGIQENQVPWIGKYLPVAVNRFYIQMTYFFDILSSHRLTLANYSIAEYGISLLGGSEIEARLDSRDLKGYFYLDSGMIRLLQEWGIIITVVFMILSVMLMKYFIDKKQYHYIIAGIVIAVWGVNEDMLVMLATNFLVVFMGQALVHNVRKIVTKNKQKEET